LNRAFTRNSKQIYGTEPNNIIASLAV